MGGRPSLGVPIMRILPYPSPLYLFRAQGVGIQAWAQKAGKKKKKTLSSQNPDPPNPPQRLFACAVQVAVTPVLSAGSTAG